MRSEQGMFSFVIPAQAGILSFLLREWILKIPAFAGMTVVVFSLFCAGVYALGIEEPLPDAAQEARARALFHELRCVVCQGETLADSPAEVAVDMRREIRRQVADGKADETIKAYFVERYGEFVLMQPPIDSAPLLWLLPLMIMGGAAFGVALYFRKRGV